MLTAGGKPRHLLKTKRENDMSRPSNVSDEHLEYLDDLRESGETNMFGAAPYVEMAFNVPIQEARTITRYWMDTFGTESR